MPHAKDALPAASLDALGNETRREILRALAEAPRTVGALAREFPISRPAVSRHLRVLEEASLVRHVTTGTTNVYEVDPQGFDAARKWLDGFWDIALARFKLLAENTAREDRERGPG